MNFKEMNLIYDLTSELYTEYVRVERCCDCIFRQVTSEGYLPCLKMKRLQLETQKHREPDTK